MRCTLCWLLILSDQLTGYTASYFNSYTRNHHSSWLWIGNPYLGLVVGLALALNTMIAVSIGGGVPLLLKKLEIDPAIASGPILTTITDMCGFFLVLGLATLMLPLLI